MPSNLQTPSDALEALAQELRPDLEKSAYELVVEGFKEWESGGFKRKGNRERHFNIRMESCMKDVRRKRNLPFVIIYENTTPTDEMSEGDDDSAKSSRVDIALFSWEYDPDEIYLTIECKLLRPKRLPRLYVVEGIDRFVQGRYGGKTRIGAMIGYVLEGTPERVIDLINSQIERRWDSGHRLTLTDSIGWLETVYSSQHHRESAFSPITLTHFLFNMNDIESYPLSSQLPSTGTDRDAD